MLIHIDMEIVIDKFSPREFMNIINNMLNDSGGKVVDYNTRDKNFQGSNDMRTHYRDYDYFGED